ncbi:MAG: lipoate--protein ligase, partial [Candidatus Geothermarchaeales archaeon]
VLLEARSVGRSSNTLRLLQFKPRCVLIGYHQCVESEVRLDYCLEHGIQVNRRITGGGAIFFQPEHIGWEIIADKASFDGLPDIGEMSRVLSKGLIDGLRELGIEAGFRPRNDVEVNGRKISGMGGTELGNAFLFQGTLLTECDLQAMLHALRIPIKKLSDKEIDSVRDRVTTIEWEIGRVPDLSRLKQTLLDGFSEALGVELVQGDLTSLEYRLLSDRLPKFLSKKWIFGERRPNKISEVHASRKTPGGIVHVALTVDRGLIESVLITGDFFAYPRRCVKDLEAMLKFTRAKPENVHQIINEFFETHSPRLPGIDANTLMKIFSEALEKLSYGDYGLSNEESNNIHVINTTLKSALKTGFDTILVPYCCKDLECGFRNREDCVMCGGCDASFLYHLGVTHGLRVRTIINYDHLKRVLTELDNDNSKGYLGACCEPWYEKHHLDLESFKTPGVLLGINSDSCYDLGMEKIAHQGGFESQTSLNLGLISKIFDISKRGELDQRIEVKI